ncbi:MAG: hypothetical protein E2600_06000 [Chryseobacterium sp.]|nr:hypothetical protein [Chryseobacterium sp.]
MRNSILILTLLCLLNCKKDNSVLQKKELSGKNTGNSFNINQKSKQVEQSILNNDTISYNRAFKEYVTNGHHKEFLYYAILMAEKNNYKGAYQDISSILEFTVDDPLNYQSKFSLFSLLKAYEMGNKVAAGSVKYIYTDKGKEIPKSSSIYCK